MSQKYTKDKLIEMLFENQSVIRDQVERNIKAFDGVQDALKQINDQNILHMSKDDARADVIKKLVDGNEKWYKLINTIIIVTIAALVILAGAEKALKFFSFL